MTTPVQKRPLFPFDGRWFSAGLFLALVGLSFAGWRASRTPYHQDFTRFSPTISPEGSYYPTVGEMCSIVRSKCRPDQILVIVGGNSIFFGVGQPRDVMWTRRLQELLGPEYCVVNFAFRGSAPFDGGAVASEVLRDEYPRQIYVANSGPLQPGDAIGSDTFRFIFWEAYFKGMLKHEPLRNARVRYYMFFDPNERRYRWDLPLYAQLDRLLHFRDLWNYVGYEKVFTIPTWRDATLKDVMKPRKLYPDNEDDGRLIPFERRFRKEVWEPEMVIVRGFSQMYYEPEQNGSWKLRDGVRENFLKFAVAGRPEELRRRTLIVLSKNSPYFLRMLSPEERLRDDLAYRDSIRLWEDAGYVAMTYGEMDDQDFLDRTHLMPSGGQRLAGDVAAKIRSMAASLNYVKATNP